MNRKLELVKKKRAKKQAEELSKRELVEKQVSSQQSLEKAVEALSVALDKDEYDFDQLKDKLQSIEKRLDLAPLFKSLEKSIKNISQKPRSNKTQIEGFSELHETIKKIKPTVVVGNVADEYRPSDAKYESGENYFGFLHPTGKWYIMRQSGAGGGIFRYANGPSKYTDAWAGRTTLDYKRYDQVKL